MCSSPSARISTAKNHASSAVGRTRLAEPSLQAIEGGPERFAAVAVAHPDLWNEAGIRTVAMEVLRSHRPVDVALADLHALAVHSRGIHEMKVVGVKANERNRLGQGDAEVVDSELGVREIQTEPDAEGRGETLLRIAVLTKRLQFN